MILQTLSKKPGSVKELPEWNFDGSSTGQAPGDNSDVFLRPVAMFPDPFRLGDNVLVMCETWMSDGKPNQWNFRHDADVVMTEHAKHEFWFGLEQEYTLFDVDGTPFGWPKGGFPGPQGPYYCGVGTSPISILCFSVLRVCVRVCANLDLILRLFTSSNRHRKGVRT